MCVFLDRAINISSRAGYRSVLDRCWSDCGRYRDRYKSKKVTIFKISPKSWFYTICFNEFYFFKCQIKETWIGPKKPGTGRMRIKVQRQEIRQGTKISFSIRSTCGKFNFFRTKPLTTLFDLFSMTMVHILGLHCSHCSEKCFMFVLETYGTYGFVMA